jgi:hypothetical protein
MNLRDAPIAHQGFFVAHFFTVRDQGKSKDFYVNSWRESDQAREPLLH